MAADMQQLIEQLGALTAAVSHQGQVAPPPPPVAVQPDPFSQMAHQLLQANPSASLSDLMAQMGQGGSAASAPKSEDPSSCGSGCLALGEVKQLRAEMAQLAKVVESLLAGSGALEE